MIEPIRDPSENDMREDGRWNLIRDVAVLQMKLIVDGLRDLILVPASLIAGTISLLKSDGGQPGPQFYQLLRAGRQSERWINLFAAYNNRPEAMNDHDDFGDVDIDELVSRVEAYVVDEYRRGDITAQAKVGIDKALDTIQRMGGQDK